MQLKTTHEDGSLSNIFPQSIPDKCPMCHYNITPVFCHARYSTQSHFKDYEIIWRCPNQSCYHLFITRYIDGVAKESVPKIPELPVVDTNLIKVSARFYDIYRQSIAAKTYGLLELVGMGLRKALEVLIKDYCSEKNQQDVEDIKSMSLNACINKYCEGRVKVCAHKCRILGNDETHYERKYEARDISDLEKLINVTLYWISAELTEASYSDVSN